jgi:hypothetical protein
MKLPSYSTGSDCISLNTVVNNLFMLRESLSAQHGVSSGCGWRDGLQQWRVAANILNKEQRTNDKGWFSIQTVVRVLITFHRKKINLIWQFL